LSLVAQQTGKVKLSHADIPLQAIAISGERRLSVVGRSSFVVGQSCERPTTVDQRREL
jgi:hypothetical protein